MSQQTLIIIDQLIKFSKLLTSNNTHYLEFTIVKSLEYITQYDTPLFVRLWWDWSDAKFKISFIDRDYQNVWYEEMRWGKVDDYLMSMMEYENEKYEFCDAVRYFGDNGIPTTFFEGELTTSYEIDLENELIEEIRVRRPSLSIH